MPARPDLIHYRFPRWPRLAFLVYAVSFLLPFDSRTMGWQIFLLGMSVCYLPDGWPWLANPLLWLSWWLARTAPMTAFVLTTLSFSLALSFLLVHLVLGMGPGLPGLAYWIWLASMAVAALGSGIDWYHRSLRAASNSTSAYDKHGTVARPEPTDLGIQK